MITNPSVLKNGPQKLIVVHGPNQHGSAGSAIAATTNSAQAINATTPQRSRKALMFWYGSVVLAILLIAYRIQVMAGIHL